MGNMIEQQSAGDNLTLFKEAVRHEDGTITVVGRVSSEEMRRKTAQELGQIGSQAAYDAADSSWKDEAILCVKAAATRLQIITVDNVWAELQSVNQHENVNGSALGNVMKLAAQAGYIQKTRTYQPSDRPAAHGRPVCVWQSLIYNRSVNAD